MLEIARDAAVALFTELGLKSAAKWNAKRMAGKLAKVDMMVDEDVVIEDPDVCETLTACLEAIANDDEIVVVSEVSKEVSAEDELAAPKAKAKAKAKAKDAPAKKESKKESKKEPEPEKEQFPGVREAKTRSYYAGTVVAKHGMAAGVTKDMLDELNEAFGKANDVESRFRLKDAWHAIRGYLDICEG